MSKRSRVLARSCAAAAVVLGLAMAPAGAAPVAPVVADGQGLQAEQWWLDELGVREAWQTTQGEGATICLVDTGVDRAHPDLRGADLVPGGGDGQGFEVTSVVDPGHGTSMATWMVGQGHGPGNRDGILGVAPKARVVSWSFDLSAPGPQAEAARSEAIRGCVDGGADIISLSLSDHPVPEDIAYAQENDVVVIGAAGNFGPGQFADNSQLGEVSVGGVMADLQVWPGSSHTTSLQVNQGRTPIALTAPAAKGIGPDGAGLPVTTATTVDEGTYETLDGYGTSGATAITAGIAALVVSAHPELDAANVINRLVSTATVPQGVDSPSPEYGFGIVDAAAAVSEDVPEVEANPLGSVASGDLGLWGGDAGAGTPGSGSDATTGPISMGTIVTLLVAAGLMLAVVVVLIVVLTRRGRPRT